MADLVGDNVETAARGATICSSRLRRRGHQCDDPRRDDGEEGEHCRLHRIHHVPAGGSRARLPGVRRGHHVSGREAVSPQSQRPAGRRTLTRCSRAATPSPWASPSSASASPRASCCTLRTPRPPGSTSSVRHGPEPASAYAFVFIAQYYTDYKYPPVQPSPRRPRPPRHQHHRGRRHRHGVHRRAGALHLRRDRVSVLVRAD